MKDQGPSVVNIFIPTCCLKYTDIGLGWKGYFLWHRVTRVDVLFCLLIFLLSTVLIKAFSIESDWNPTQSSLRKKKYRAGLIEISKYLSRLARTSCLNRAVHVSGPMLQLYFLQGLCPHGGQKNSSRLFDFESWRSWKRTETESESFKSKWRLWEVLPGQQSILALISEARKENTVHWWARPELCLPVPESKAESWDLRMNGKWRKSSFLKKMLHS